MSSWRVIDNKPTIAMLVHSSGIILWKRLLIKLSILGDQVSTPAINSRSILECNWEFWIIMRSSKLPLVIHRSNPDKKREFNPLRIRFRVPKVQKVVENTDTKENSDNPITF